MVVPLGPRPSGPGILVEDRERIFDPFFTDKIRRDGIGTRDLFLPVVEKPRRQIATRQVGLRRLDF